jgi:hypothetical protein
MMVRQGKQTTCDAVNVKWRRLRMGDYVRGRTPTGELSPEHQTFCASRSSSPADSPDQLSTSGTRRVEGSL